MAQYPFNETMLRQALTYDQYRKAIHSYLKYLPDTDAAKKMQGYISKNQSMMDEFDVNYRVSASLKNAVVACSPMTWVVITEGWCGDAAFNIPMFALLEQYFPEKIKLALFLRDRNPDMIDAYLTDGGRSIPKLIILDSNYQEVANWGPRPAPLHELSGIWKNEEVPLKEMILKVRDWYIMDDTATLQEELVQLLSK